MFEQHHISSCLSLCLEKWFVLEQHLISSCLLLSGICLQRKIVAGEIDAEDDLTASIGMGGTAVEGENDNDQVQTRSVSTKYVFVFPFFFYL